MKFRCTRRPVQYDCAFENFPGREVARISSYLHSLQARTRLAADARWQMLWHANPGFAPLALLYGGYLLAAQVGQAFAVIPGIDITFWPPAGLVLGTLLLTNKSSWPWWLLAALLGELTANALWFRNPLHFTALYIAGNLVEAVGGALLLAWLSPAPSRINTLKDIMLFAIAAAVAPVAAATIIAFVDAFLALKNTFAETWALVWLGDSTGILAVAPFVLVTAHFWRNRRGFILLEILEPSLVMVGALAIFVASMYTWQQLAYANIPLLVWIAVRSRFGGVGLAIVLLTLTGSYFAANKIGVFAEADLLKLRVVFLQSYLGISALVSLLVAALAQQYSEALNGLKEANKALAENVAHGAARLTQSEGRLALALEAAEAGTWAWEEPSKLPVWDARFQQVHGIKADEPQTFETWTGKIHPDDQRKILAKLEQLPTSPTSDQWEAEYRVIHPELGEKWILSIGRAEYRRGGTLTGLSGIALDITFRKTHEDRLRMLMRESNHRKKNLLAVVLAIARNTASHRPEDFLERFQARIHSLAAGYDLLINSAWRGVDLRQLIDLQLGHFGGSMSRQISVAGPDVRINASAAQTVGMALYELATNASKYGALSASGGRVEIKWEIQNSAEPAKETFRMSWIESGGPPVRKPNRKGFGTEVIEKMIQMSLTADVDIDFDRKGLSWMIACPIDQILEAGSNR